MVSMMQNTATEIEEIERRLTAAGGSVRQLADKANICLTTWYRWKSGQIGGRLDSWRRVQAALSAIEAEAAHSSEAP